MVSSSSMQSRMLAPVRFWNIVIDFTALSSNFIFIFKYPDLFLLQAAYHRHRERLSDPVPELLLVAAEVLHLDSLFLDLVGQEIRAVGCYHDRLNLPGLDGPEYLLCSDDEFLQKYHSSSNPRNSLLLPLALHLFHVNSQLNHACADRRQLAHNYVLYYAVKRVALPVEG